MARYRPAQLLADQRRGPRKGRGRCTPVAGQCSLCKADDQPYARAHRLGRRQRPRPQHCGGAPSVSHGTDPSRVGRRLIPRLPTGARLRARGSPQRPPPPPHPVALRRGTPPRARRRRRAGRRAPAARGRRPRIGAVGCASGLASGACRRAVPAAPARRRGAARIGAVGRYGTGRGRSGQSPTFGARGGARRPHAARQWRGGVLPDRVARRGDGAGSAATATAAVPTATAAAAGGP